MNWQNNEDELKRVIDSYEFPYNEGDWLAAKNLLLARKRKRRNTLWLVAASLFIIAGATAVWVANGPKTAVSQKSTQAIQNNTTAPATTNGLPNADATAPQTTTPQQNTGTATPAATLPANGNATHHNINGAAPTQQPINKSASTTAPNNTLGTNNTPNSPQPVVPQNTTEGQTPGSNSDITQTTETTTQPLAEEVPKPIANNTPVVDEQPATPATPAEEATTPTDEKNNKTTPTKNPKQVLIKNTIALAVGGNWGGQNNIANSPYFGVQYYRHLPNPNWVLGIGLAYTQLNTTALNKEITGKQHSFGATQTQITISTNRLQYLEMPLFAKHSIKQRVAIMGGLNMGYLLNTRNTITQTTYNTFTGIEQTGRQTTTAYKHGISPFDVQLQIGAEVALRNRLWLGMWANGGLFDVGRNTYYNNTVFERNLRLQLYIKYDVFKF
jgi:hypothetical protein